MGNGRTCQLGSGVWIKKLITEGLKFCLWCCSGSWVAEFQKAAEVVSTSSGAKSHVSEAFNSIGKLGTSARQGDAGAAKKAFVSAVSSLQSWASDARITVKGL